MIDLFQVSDMTLLVTDDDIFNLKIILRILEKNGYHTLSALNGYDCLLLAEKEQPDLILLDIRMPEMDGLEVCRRLKQNPATAEIPVIFVTGETNDDVLKEAFESGGADFVRKPVNRIELLSRVKSELTHQIFVRKLLEEEKFQGVIEMAGAVCHELNQPMQAISGYTELLMMDIDDQDPRYGRIEKIKTQVDRMGEITKKLMRITKYVTRGYLGSKKIIDIDKSSE